jgi:hypothetical protein
MWKDPKTRGDFKKRVQVLRESNNGKWSHESREAFGTWMIDWLEHAGYMDGSSMPNLHKAILMTAYPPLMETGLSVDERWDRYVLASARWSASADRLLAEEGGRRGGRRTRRRGTTVRRESVLHRPITMLLNIETRCLFLLGSRDWCTML